MIVISNLTKSYPTEHGRRYVFRDLNLTLPTGAGIGLIGLNGAGKSTLIKLIGGMEAPDTGRIVTNQRISWPVALGGGLVRILSGDDHVRFVCRMMGLQGAETREVVDYVREFAELGDYFHLPVASYSPGMRARLTFGTSMAFDYDYYLIDEVLAVGDPVFRKKAAEVFKQKLQRAGVIMASHNFNEIRDNCSVVILIHRGEAIVYDDVDEGLNYFEENVKKKVSAQ